MTRVSAFHLREHLPSYLKRTQAGEAIQITSLGCVIAWVEPEHDPAQEARRWLDSLKGRVTLVDVVSSLGPDTADATWYGDANHL